MRDGAGLAMVAGLLLKEVPYLALMTLAALNQVPHRALRMSTARARLPRRDRPGSRRSCRCVYPQLRLPIFAVLAFSLSTVEVGADPRRRATRRRSPCSPRAGSPTTTCSATSAAAAAALLQLLIVVALHRRAGSAAERDRGRLGTAWCERGVRDGWTEALARGRRGMRRAHLRGRRRRDRADAALVVRRCLALSRALPEQLGLGNWRVQGRACSASSPTPHRSRSAPRCVALLLSLACLESESRRDQPPTRRAMWLAYAPLLVPQIAFLYGFQVVLVQLGLDGRWLAVAWAHLVFVLPYVFLSLADPWRALDPRYPRSAAALGVTPWQALLAGAGCRCSRGRSRVAFAIGFAVSVGQYLPTLFAGAGRIATLTTEAVTLSSGGDRRVLGVYTFLQAALPLARLSRRARAAGTGVPASRGWHDATCRRAHDGMRLGR